MPNCKCSEPETKCPLCGCHHCSVEAGPGDSKPRGDCETVRLYSEVHEAPEYSRKFVRLYTKPEKNAEEKPQ